MPISLVILSAQALAFSVGIYSPLRFCPAAASNQRGTRDRQAVSFLHLFGKAFKMLAASNYKKCNTRINVYFVVAGGFSWRVRGRTGNLRVMSPQLLPLSYAPKIPGPRVLCKLAWKCSRGPGKPLIKRASRRRVRYIPAQSSRGCRGCGFQGPGLRYGLPGRRKSIRRYVPR